MPQNLKNIALEVVTRLDKAYPDARQELNFTTAFELLIATILAAQCTDARVNQVTKTLFKKYPDPESILAVNPEEFEQDIKTISFFRKKAQGIRKACKILADEFAGKVPSDIDDLIKLPYVGRKTANIVRSNALGIPAIGVDTHTLRVPNRLGWVNTDNPDRVEKALCELLPEGKWHRANIVIQWHGRYTCKAKNPDCGLCVVNQQCQWENKTS